MFAAHASSVLLVTVRMNICELVGPRRDHAGHAEAEHEVRLLERDRGLRRRLGHREHVGLRRAVS